MPNWWLNFMIIMNILLGFALNGWANLVFAGGLLFWRIVIVKTTEDRERNAVD